MSPAARGRRQSIDLDALLADRADLRNVTLAGRSYQFRPMSLMSAIDMEEGRVKEAFFSLIVNGADDFLAACPIDALGDVVKAIYGGVVVGEASSPSAGSAKTRNGSAPSKRTSSSVGSR